MWQWDMIHVMRAATQRWRAYARYLRRNRRWQRYRRERLAILRHWLLLWANAVRATYGRPAWIPFAVRVGRSLDEARFRRLRPIFAAWRAAAGLQ